MGRQKAAKGKQNHPMLDRDALVTKTVKRLQKIKTLDDFKAARQDIFDLMEKLILSAIDQLKAFFENMFTLSDDERMTAAAKIQNDDYLFSPDVMRELDRLTELPGADTYREEFTSAMEKHIGPRLQEAAEQMGKVMEAFMGGMAQGVAKALGADAQEEAAAEEPFEFDHDNPDTPHVLYSLYMARSLAELEEQKDSMIEGVETEMQYDIGELESLTDPDFIDALKDNKERVDTIRHRASRIAPEMEKEFARIAALPGAAESAARIKKEMTERLADPIGKLNGLLAQAKKLLA